jgi:membrane-associated phospholipid phosphatase
MARFGPIRRPWNWKPARAVGPLWRFRRVASPLLALVIVALATRSLMADDGPGLVTTDAGTINSVTIDSALTTREASPALISSFPLYPSASFAPASLAPGGCAGSCGSPKSGCGAGLVAIDASANFPYCSSTTPSTLWPSPTAASSGSGIWAALVHWEARLWRSDRPAIVLTSDETPLIGPDEGSPRMPGEQPEPLAPADGLAPPLGSSSAAAVTGLQPIDGCSNQPIRFSDDAWAFLPRVAHDAWGLVNWDDAIVLGVALGGSLALRGDVDQDVRNWTAEHPDRWGHATNLLGDFGTVQYQIPVIFGAYAFTLWEQDEWHHDMMTSMISAYTIFGLSTLTIKGIADTKRPSDGWNGGSYGFPSWHDGSLFCMSAVIDEYEGHWIGVPLYILSGLVGWSRIDARDHDLSDVVFGGVLGYVIGKSVAGRALYGDSRVVHIVPYFHPSDGSAGVMFDAKF